MQAGNTSYEVVRRAWVATGLSPFIVRMTGHDAETNVTDWAVHFKSRALPFTQMALALHDAAIKLKIENRVFFQEMHIIHDPQEAVWVLEFSTILLDPTL